MRCISPFGAYSITVFEGNEQILTDARGYAQQVVLKKPVIANFEKSGLLDHEEDVALSSFAFSGLAEGIHPLTRVSVFDTEAYCQSLPANERDEMQVQMDQRLRELQEKNKGDFIIVEPVEIPKPWPSYDDNEIEEILQLQSATGKDPADVYRYEVSNAERPEILEAMLRQFDPDQADAKYGADTDEEPITVVT